MNNFFEVPYVVAATESASSTSHNLGVAWPYVVFSVLLAVSLAGVARRILRNKNR